MWPLSASEPSKPRRLGVAIGVASALVLAALLVWQWPNLTGPRSSEAESATSRLVPQPSAAEPPAVVPEAPVGVVPTPTDSTVVPPPEVVTEAALPVVKRPEPPADTPEAAVREVAAVPERPSPARVGDLVVHVGSFHDAARADRLRQRLAGAGLATYETRDTVDGNPWVRVYAGPFETRVAAEQARDRLTGDGIVAYARIITVGQ